jgi:iron(III) transport system substrate-binding protein
MYRRTLLGTAMAAAVVGPVSAQTSTVVVYTAAPQSFADVLTTQFTKDTGIKVELVVAGSSDVVRRVIAEASNPRGDVIWSIGAETLEANTKVLEPYAPAEKNMLVPAYYVSKVWVPFSGILAAFVVNKNLVKPAEYPKTWRDLGDPKWKGQVSSARADSSGSSFQQLATVLTIYGDKGWDVYRPILANMQLADSSGLVSRLVNDGEAKLGIILEDDALRYVKGGGPVAIVYPEDGTSTLADAMGLIKGGPNPANGKKFIDWLLTKPAQEVVVRELGRRAVRTDVPSGGGAKPLTEIKIIDYNIPEIASHRNAWIAHWTEMAAAR